MTSRTTAPRPRIIERWFPCAEVSAASSKGWGSSNSETLIMSWFAKRPLAQSRAAVLCSLLPWPEDHDEQGQPDGDPAPAAPVEALTPVAGFGTFDHLVLHARRSDGCTRTGTINPVGAVAP